MTQDGSVNWFIVLVTSVLVEASAFFLKKKKNQTFKKKIKTMGHWTDEEILKRKKCTMTSFPDKYLRA